MAGRIEAMYAYSDDLGRPVLRKLRQTSKRFQMQSALIKHDRLYWKGGPGCILRYQPDWGRRALYNLPVLLDALRHGDTAFVAEGERDCDTATALWRLPATTNWQGASQFTLDQAEWFNFGRGHSKVVILMDNDDAGHQAGWLRYQALRTVGVKRKRISLYRPTSPRLKDPTDVALAGLDGSAYVPVGVGEVEERAIAYAAAHPRGTKGTSDWMRR